MWLHREGECASVGLRYAGGGRGFAFSMFYLNPIICFLFVKFKEIYDPLVIPRSLILIERDNFLDYREEMRSDSC